MKKLIFIFSLSALILVGCEKHYKCTIWVNTDVECCNVKNPIDNLEWLKELYNVYKDAYKTTEFRQPDFFFLFQNDTTQENFIVIDTKGEYSSWIHIYDCNGNKIDGGVYDRYDSPQNTLSNDINASPPVPCHICDEFFKTHTLIDTIAYLIVEP